MSLFSEIEKTIERGFRHWTEKVFGEANSDELLLVHRGILEEVESHVKTGARGKRIFPYGHVTVTLCSPDEARRTLYEAAFAEGGRLESDIREALEGAGCEPPRGFSVEIATAEAGEHPFQVDFQLGTVHVEPAVPAAPVTGRLIVVKGKTDHAEYALDRGRINIGRLAELTDSEQRVVRRNDVVFEEGGDKDNATVSRCHAHIRRDEDEFRICDDESEFGTRVFRDGRSIEVPRGNRRGERLRPGDEIYLGRACLRFEK